jgi:micrococcal nuclease
LSRKSIRWWQAWWLRAALFFLVWGIPAACGQSPSAGQDQEALVAKVLDGDTVQLADGRRVRLLGIDAPELEKEGQPAEFLAHQAKKALADLVQGQRVRLEFDELRYDRYGRTLAHLRLADGTLVSLELVRRGLARVYTVGVNFRHRDELLKAQQEALEAKRGIWLKALAQDESYYLGNKNSKILHRPTCPFGSKTAPANRVRFTSKAEALRQGYSPCRSCKP